jgi:hypothetical protein
MNTFQLYIQDAAINLGATSTFTFSETEVVDWCENENPPSNEALDTEINRLKAEYDANQYQRDRQYPSIGDQLDMQYHDQLDGTTTWKDAIAKVKSDNPKE